MTPIDLQLTNCGFLCGEFDDHYGNHCSIQESSHSTANEFLWLGRRPDLMHLTREMAAALIPLLERFVRTGNLREGS